MMGWYLINYHNYRPDEAQRLVGVQDIIHSSEYQRYFWLMQ